MANEILAPYGVSGRTVYAVVRNSVGQVWQTTTSTFVTYVGANLANYAITLTEQGSSGVYAGNMPAAAAGVYAVVARDRAGGSPAESDAIAAAGPLEWDGSAVVPLSSRSTLTATQVWANGTRTLTSLSGLTVDTVTTLTSLPSIPNDWITAAAFAAGALNGKGDWPTGTIPTAAQNAAGLLDLADGVEVGLTPRQVLRLLLAALGGNVSADGTTYYAPDGTTVRLTMAAGGSDGRTVVRSP